jgi:hypothetical protein
MKLFYPQYIYIVQKTARHWRFREPKIFYSGSNNINLDRWEEFYGLTLKQIIIELFKINAGKLGFYLVDMKHQKYYYCGTEFSDIKQTLLFIGIGKSDPLENGR